jgi:hypothetical protein
MKTEELEIAALDEGLAKKVADEIAAREARLRANQKGVLGMKRVLEFSPLKRPEATKRSPIPSCFATSIEVRNEFTAKRSTFVDSYRASSARLRNGELGTAFPMYSFRPSSAVAS